MYLTLNFPNLKICPYLLTYFINLITHQSNIGVRLRSITEEGPCALATLTRPTPLMLWSHLCLGQGRGQSTWCTLLLLLLLFTKYGVGNVMLRPTTPTQTIMLDPMFWGKRKTNLWNPKNTNIMSWRFKWIKSLQIYPQIAEFGWNCWFWI